MLWDAMMCHGIMKSAEVKAIGVTTSVEIFNEAMDKCTHTHHLALNNLLSSWLCLRGCVVCSSRWPRLCSAHSLRADCPQYESDPSTLSEDARLQILRAIGVAIANMGEMFPTLKILLDHAINYLGMKKHPCCKEAGIIDNKEAFIEDMGKLSLDERRAVLCVHMICYVLDGTIGNSE